MLTIFCIITLCAVHGALFPGYNPFARSIFNN